MALCKVCNPGRHALHRLTDNQVREIRKLYEPLPEGADPKAYPERLTYRGLAERFGVGRDTIMKIIKYESYEWVI